MEAADAWGLAEKLTEAVDQSTVLARGPKARGAIRASGLRETWSPESESSSEVLAHLITAFDLDGKRIAVQLHGEPLPDVVQTLRLAGAEVIEVPVYRWVPPEDAAPLHRLIQAVVPPRSTRWRSPARRPRRASCEPPTTTGCGDAVRAALRGPVVPACVGPGDRRPASSRKASR